jgi:hypothetical protein
MTTQQVIEIKSILNRKDKFFEPGLPEEAVLRIGDKFAVHFPQDIKLFLQTGFDQTEIF